MKSASHDGIIFARTQKKIDSRRLSVIQYYGVMGCRQVVRHETLTLALRWFDPSHPSQKSPRMKFGEVFTFSLFTLHFSLNPLHRSLLPFSVLCPDLDLRKGLFCVFPKAIGSVSGFEPTKAQNQFVISLLRAFLARRCSFQSFLRD